MEAKMYLMECDNDIIDPEVANGLSMECYYAYLLEISAVLPDDKMIRKEYEGKREAVQKLMSISRTADPECVKWLIGCIEQYEQELRLFKALIGKINSYNVADVRPLKLAQLRFMLSRLGQQKKYFKTVLFFSPSRQLFSGGDTMIAHAETMRKQDEVEKDVLKLIATFEK